MLCGFRSQLCREMAMHTSGMRPTEASYMSSSGSLRRNIDLETAGKSVSVHYCTLCSAHVYFEQDLNATKQRDLIKKLNQMD